MFTVNADLFRLTSLFTSTEEARYYLQGVCIEKHPHLPGAILTATDGHRLLVSYDAEAQVDDLAGPIIVRLDKAALAACKPAKRETGGRLVAFDDSKLPAQVLADGRPVALSLDWLIDGTFPDWRRVLPKDCAPCVQAFNPALFAPFATVAASFSSEPNITIETVENNGPARIRFHNAPHILGVLMPMSKHVKTGMPDFLQPAPALEQAA